MMDIYRDVDMLRELIANTIHVLAIFDHAENEIISIIGSEEACYA